MFNQDKNAASIYDNVDKTSPLLIDGDRDRDRELETTTTMPTMSMMPNLQLHPLETRHTKTATSPSPFVLESLLLRKPRKGRYMMALQTSDSDTAGFLPKNEGSDEGFVYLYAGEKSKHLVQNEPCYIFQSVVKDNYDHDVDDADDADDADGNKEKRTTASTAITNPTTTDENAETRATAIKNKNKKKKRRTLWGTVVRKPGMEKTGDTYAVTYDVVYHVDRTRQTNYVMTGILTGQDMVVATIVYDYVPKWQYWYEGGRPRYAQLHIVGRDALETKEPSRNAQGQRVLDFYGRGSSRSAKNIQLVNNQHTTNNNDTTNKNNLVLQLVKCGRNLYHLDFSAPIEAFHAMAFALAQFDFKTR